jgi:hypothetical protein
MKTLNQFREDNGLATFSVSTDASGVESELLNDLSQLLRNNADGFRRILKKCLNAGLSNDEENDVKKLIGIIGHLKESPREKKEKVRDELDNVVIRQSNAGAGGGESGGGGE